MMLGTLILVWILWTGALGQDIESWTRTLKVHGDHCNAMTEDRFLTLLKSTTDYDLSWAEDDPQWDDVCNPFKYFTCDVLTDTCGCCNNADDHVYYDPGAEKCRIRVGGQCGGSPNVYHAPCFDNPLFKPLAQYAPDVSLPAIMECTNGIYTSKLDRFVSHLLEYGNNDLGNDLLPKKPNGLGVGSPCNITEENRFHTELKIRFNQTDFDWIQDFKAVCNVFKYLRCDGPSGKCVCWHEDLFWAPEEIVYDKQAPTWMDYGRYKGRCRVALERQDSCSVDLPPQSVLPKYKKPFDLDIFNHLPEPVGSDHELETIKSRNLRCVQNSYNHLGHFECPTERELPKDLRGDPCKTDLYFLREEIGILRRRGGKDTDWSFPPNDLCEEQKQGQFLRVNEPNTWDFDNIRDIISKMETRDYCNPFIYQTCFRGICGCQRPIPLRNLTHGEKAGRYSYQNNECIIEEGVTCSRRYWYNGNWVDYLDDCDNSLKCVLAPDKLNHICCDPDELKQNRIPMDDHKKGRCRDLLLAYNHPLSNQAIIRLLPNDIQQLLIIAIALINFKWF